MRTMIGKLLIIAIGGTATAASAQQPKLRARIEKKTSVQSPAPGKDEIAIRKRIDSYVVAYNRGDAKAVADHWREDAVYVDPIDRKTIKGRAAIEAMFKEKFSGERGAHLVVNVDSIRLVSPDVAVEEGSAIVKGPDGPSQETGYTAIHIRQKDQWYLDSVRETDMPQSGSSYERLASLDWLIGSWIDQDDEVTVVSRYEWTAGRHFISQTFHVAAGNRIELQGTQIIGWDPVRKRIRSWVFDSDGGYSEGTWKANGDRWIINQSGYLADGRQSSATNVINKLDDDSFTWKSTGRSVAGSLLPNVDEVTVARQTQIESAIR